MNAALKILTLGVLTLFLWCNNSYASDITIPDGLGSGTGWNGSQEDNEVENGNLQSQAWDLEAFRLDGNTLTLIGGYNFKDGQADPYYPQYSGRLPVYYSGDIFLATGGIEPTYGLTALPTTGGNVVKTNQNKYNYVLDLNLTTMKYDVYAIDANSTIRTVWFSSNYEGNPWRYESGGTLLKRDLSLGYQTGLSDTGTGLQGGSHNALGVDLSFLAPGTEFYAHFTQQCGNDNIMGHGNTPIPEPGTMLLFGTGLLGLAGLGKKRLVKKAI
jgi:hypothetical protein